MTTGFRLICVLCAAEHGTGWELQKHLMDEHPCARCGARIEVYQSRAGEIHAACVRDDEPLPLG